MLESQLEGYDKATRLASKRMSPRAHRLAELERWVDGTQYDHLADWFDDVPIAEKAPCVVEPLVADSIESHVDMVLGESRFPDLTTRPGEDEDDEDDPDDEGGLNEDDSSALDELIESACKQARFGAICREALAMSMGCGSVSAIYGAREGRLFGETVKARWCEPEFITGNCGPLKRLVIEYPYIETYQDQDGTWKVRACIFRREIDAATDITMRPADAELAKPNWVPAQTIAHGLGFCPVVWYPFIRGCSIVGQIDGAAPHANLRGEIRALDVAVSQRHRAALYAGDPQWTECGVELGSSPSSMGRGSMLVMTEKGGAPSGDNPVVNRIMEPSGAKPGRKKDPGSIWQFEDKDTKVELHQLNGDALKAISENASDIRTKIMQALAYVPLDPETSSVMRGSLSGKALESLKERQLNRDDKIRDDFGDGFIKPSASMLLRICHVKGAGLRVKGLTKASGILARFASEGSDAVA
jgi:hypothetical protein